MYQKNRVCFGLKTGVRHGYVFSLLDTTDFVLVISEWVREGDKLKGTENAVGSSRERILEEVLRAISWVRELGGVALLPTVH